jgi:large repetitive protein
MKRVPLLILLLAMFVALSPPASATIQTLSDGNSSVGISTDTQAGMYNWTIDGYSILYQQWFWYRVGSAGPEQSIDTLGINSQAVTANTLNVIYGDPTKFTIGITYSLNGGQAGSATADIGEQIRINNYTGTALDMHFFQYSDFDLNRTNLQDIVVIDPSLHIVNQSPVPANTSIVLSETTENQKPNHAEANVYANTLNSLNDALPTTLNDNLAIYTPADVTWAFEWDRSVGAHSTLLISKDKILAPVPEPAAIGLLGGVLLVLATKLRKRHA